MQPRLAARDRAQPPNLDATSASTPSRAAVGSRPPLRAILRPTTAGGRSVPRSAPLTGGVNAPVFHSHNSQPTNAKTNRDNNSIGTNFHCTFVLIR